MRLVGVLPQGFPPFTIPHVTLGDIPPLLFGGALGIALVVARRHDLDRVGVRGPHAARRSTANQEMIGIGAANIAAGFFQGFPVSTSGSRTAVAEQAGAKTQVTGLVGAAVITVVLRLRAGAAAVPAAADAGAPSSSPPRCRSPTSPARGGCGGSAGPSSWLAMAAFLGVALLGVLPGIARRGRAVDPQRVPPRRGGRTRPSSAGSRGSPGYHDTGTLPGRRAAARAGRSTGSTRRCIFANARTFRDADAGAWPRTDPTLRWIVVAAEPITDVDTTAADMLEELDAELNERGVSLVFAEMKDPVREKIERYELTRTIDPAHFFPTLDDAVAEYVRQTSATWESPGAAPM